MLLFLKQKKRIVVYQREANFFLMIPAGAAEEVKEAFSTAWVQRFNEKLVMDDGPLSIFALNGSLADIPRLKGLVFVVDQDVGEAAVPGYAETLQILVSSPRTQRVSKFAHNQTNLLRIYLPVWTLDEMKDCYLMTGRLNKSDKNAMKSMEENFKKYGGIPRLVMDTMDHERVFEMALARYSNSAQLEELFSSILNETKYECIASDDRGYGLFLVHQEPLSNDHHDYKCSFASAYVAERLLHAFIQLHKFKTQLTFHHLNKSLDHVTSFKIALLEGVAHDILSDSKQRDKVSDIRVLENGKSNDTNQTWPVAWKAIPNVVTCERRDLSDLHRFDESCYIVPKCENYPAVDSFGLVSKQIFTNNTKDSAKWCLAGFQMTIAKEHPIVLQGLVTTRKRVLELLAGNKKLAQQVAKEPFYVVFVVSSMAANIKKKQVEKDANEEMSFTIEQYSLELKDVVEITKYEMQQKTL